MKKILIPTDLSPNAGNAIRYALNFCKNFPAELIFLHATHPMLDLPDTSLEFYDPIVFQDEKEQLNFVRANLNKIFEEEKIDQEKLNFSIELRIGFAADEIVRVGEEFNCDLVILFISYDNASYNFCKYSIILRTYKVCASRRVCG
jgi:nucleotide-binding universal stress UspA family protein